MLDLDLSDQCKRNLFRAYHITDYAKGTIFLFGAFYENDEAKEDNIGSPIVFVFTVDLNSSSEIGALKKEKNAFQYYFETDCMH